MIHVKAPNRVKTVFLAGSIEMGKAEMWQDRLAAKVADIEDVVLFNPRRDDWDSSWKQDPTPGTQFHEQVSWELNNIESSEIIVFYFDPNTQSPITLMELGYVLGLKKRCIVCCPNGYFRKGNVIITTQRSSNAICVHTFDDLAYTLRNLLSES
jgi:nucleoside 2-deoxyribosyltransferase